MATFTLHDNLRRLTGSHQRLFYALLFRTSAAAAQKLAHDPEYVGGEIGMVGVLQTWTRDLSVLHPHVHYIVAISNNRLLKLEDGMVTFKYKHGKTKQWKVKTMPVEKFTP